jgi:formylglycine-generating enzyme required for sulfatase activity
VYNANFGEGGPGHPTPVGLYPEVATSSGIQDLVGNCSEWVDGWWRDYEKQASPDDRVIRGGYWNGDDNLLRVSVHGQVKPDIRLNSLGFRCVRDLPSR